MSFMESYKRLDNLCKDLLNSQTGVTSYIESMEKLGIKRARVPNWESDYRMLKHYRHIRNQIVHETGANEENMCTQEDTIWLEQFRRRILSRQDPLALYEKESAASRKKQARPAANVRPLGSMQGNRPARRNQKWPIAVLPFWVVSAAIIVAVCLFYIWLNQ